MQIPNDIYGLELLRWIAKTPELTTDDVAIREAIKHLCFPNMLVFDSQRFTEEECRIYQDLGLCNSDNIEIAARANDVLRKLKGDKRVFTQRASDLYLSLFDITQKNVYLLRSIQVRCIKEVCTEEYFDKIVERLPKLPSHVIQSSLESLRKSYARKLAALKPLLDRKYDECIEQYDYRNARILVESLSYIKAITADEANYRCALLYEQEADCNEANREENTFLMQTHSLYKSAYQMIEKVKTHYPVDVQRIKDKMLCANIEYANFLQLTGVRKDYSVPEQIQQMINDECAHKEITNLEGAISWLLNIPFQENEQVTECMQNRRKAALLSYMLNVSQIDVRGNTIGNANPDDGLRVEVHRHLRMSMYFAVYRYLQTIIQRRIDTSEDRWLECLSAAHSKYVSDDVVRLFAKGFSIVFDGEMVLAAHVLTPALEALLRQKAEAIHGSLKKYGNERNDDVTLDYILRVLEKDFENYDEWFELQSFLTMGIDENYRNRLMHGLMPVNHIHNQGIYLFWLCLKMYFKDLKMDDVD